MTDRVRHLTVVLKAGIREDDAMPLISAISLMKGVVSVGYDVEDLTHYVADQRARAELGGKLIAIVYPPAENK